MYELQKYLLSERPSEDLMPEEYSFMTCPENLRRYSAAGCLGQPRLTANGYKKLAANRYKKLIGLMDMFCD